MIEIANDFEQSVSVAEMLKALAHPVRLMIVALLSEQDEHVGGLARRLNLHQSTISQHMGILRIRGLVARSWENGRAVYRLAQPGLPQLIRCLEGCVRT